MLELHNRASCAVDIRSFCWREQILGSKRGSHTHGLSCVTKSKIYSNTTWEHVEIVPKGKPKEKPSVFPFVCPAPPEVCRCHVSLRFACAFLRKLTMNSLVGSKVFHVGTVTIGLFS